MNAGLLGVPTIMNGDVANLLGGGGENIDFFVFYSLTR
jgi:hypothetical protein